MKGCRATTGLAFPDPKKLGGEGTITSTGETFGECGTLPEGCALEVAVGFNDKADIYMRELGDEPIPVEVFLASGTCKMYPELQLGQTFTGTES